MALLDANGVAINVGDTVKLVGTVTAIDPASTHYKEVTITIAHPVPGVPCPELAGFAPTVEGGSIHTPGASQVIKCCNLVLVH